MSGMDRRGNTEPRYRIHSRARCVPDALEMCRFVADAVRIASDITHYSALNGFMYTERIKRKKKKRKVARLPLYNILERYVWVLEIFI